MVLPSAIFDVYLPEKKGNVYTCKGYRLDDLATAEPVQIFNHYAVNYNLIKSFELDLPHRKNMYQSVRLHLENELKSDPTISQFTEAHSPDSWVVPYGLDNVYSTWINYLNNQKSQIEEDLCNLEWYKIQNKQFSHIPTEFIAFYNAKYDSFRELLTQCEKPDIQGWTQDQSAKDYVVCMDARRSRYNQALRDIKKYQIVRNDFSKILEALGRSDELKPAYDKAK